MNDDEIKRQEVSTLIDAQVPMMKICEVVPCSKWLVQMVRKLKDDGEMM